MNPARASEGSAPALLFVRHAESTWNAAGRWQGQGDPPLSDRGREQARALSARLSAFGIEALVSSDLRRAVETAQLAGAPLGLSPRLDPQLREHDVGAWSGLTHAEIEARWPEDLARLRAGDLDVRPGGGESRRALRARVEAAIASLERELAGRRVAIVTHRGVVRALAPEVRLGHCEIWTHASGPHPELRATEPDPL